MDHPEGPRQQVPEEEPGPRDRLLAAAAELFAERGYAGTAVREICEAAGVTKPTLYYYFGSKSGLARALLSDAAADLVATLNGLAAGPQPPRERLKAMARVIFQRSGEAPRTCRFFYASFFAPQDSTPAHDLEAMIPQIVTLTADVFREGLRDGAGPGGEPEFSAMVLLGALQGYMMRFVKRQDAKLTDDLADRIVDGVLDGLAAASNREGTR